MKLSQDTLAEHFIIADSTSSWYQTPTNTFDFVDRDSKTLVVTVGDSWTWGCDLSLNNSDEQYRKDHVYGNLVSKELNADWLNLAIPAQGNFWIVAMVKELADLIPNLDYDKIIVVCTFTSVGRWFNTKYDQHIDYVSWFKDNIRQKQDFDQLLFMLNDVCVADISTSLAPFDHVVLKIGTNMVEHIGLTGLKSTQILQDPWYRLLGVQPTTLAYVCFYHDRLSTATEFIPPQYHSDFKNWWLDLWKASEQQLLVLSSLPGIMRNYHPLSAGHEIWANYIFEQLSTNT
jgi:hypothetical protein